MYNFLNFILIKRYFSTKLSTGFKQHFFAIKLYNLILKYKHMKTGKEIINDTVKTIPNKPGVYRMLDKNKNIIYVGKAKLI